MYENPEGPLPLTILLLSKLGQKYNEYTKLWLNRKGTWKRGIREQKNS